MCLTTTPSPHLRRASKISSSCSAPLRVSRSQSSSTHSTRPRFSRSSWSSRSSERWGALGLPDPRPSFSQLAQPIQERHGSATSGLPAENSFCPDDQEDHPCDGADRSLSHSEGESPRGGI